MLLEFEKIENVRDLGGILRRDGMRIRHGVLYRTGKLNRASDADIEKLTDLGIRHIIDFRDESESQRAPDREVPGAVYHSLPALPRLADNFKPVDDPSYTADEIHRDFQRIYRFLACSNEAIEAYAAFFRILLHSGGEPVIFHCTQGKDRTGVAALLLLTALGIDEESIRRDYLLTNEFTQRTLDTFAAMDEPPFSMDIAREVFLVYEENLHLYRSCVELEYGSVMNFLELALGVGPKEIETLERYYLS